MPSTKLHVGEILECSLWLSGTETPEQIQNWKDNICPVVMKQAGVNMDLSIGPIVFATKLPGEDRVPDVPDHIFGPDVKLLVAEAAVTGIRPIILPKSSFIADLDRTDLARLRTLTRRAHAKSNPGKALLTDDECDQVIEEIGPQSATKALVAAVESKMVH